MKYSPLVIAACLGGATLAVAAPTAPISTLEHRASEIIQPRALGECLNCFSGLFSKKTTADRNQPEEHELNERPLHTPPQVVPSGSSQPLPTRPMKSPPRNVNQQGSTRKAMAGYNQAPEMDRLMALGLSGNPSVKPPSTKQTPGTRTALDGLTEQQRLQLLGLASSSTSTSTTPKRTRRS